VDGNGLLELRGRWFAEEGARVANWMLVLVAVSAVGTLLTAPLMAAFGAAGFGVALPPGESLAQHFASVAGVVGLMHAWPLVAGALARGTIWPQLLRPAALAVLALAARPVPFLLGLLAGGVAAGDWRPVAAELVLLLDPINLALLVFGWFVYRRAARATADYRALVSDGEQHPPVGRRAAGRLAAAASLAFAVVLAGFMVVGGHGTVSAFALPGNAAWAERKALKDFNDGLADFPGQPARAEAAFRRALPQWQRLADAHPTRPEYRHNLAVTHQNLGTSLARLGQFRTAEEEFAAALADYDRLEAHAPGYQRHAADRAMVEQALGALRQALPNMADMEETREGHQLAAAGRHREAADVYRKALEGHEGRAAEFADPGVYAALRASKQNRLAWALVMSPDLDARDPARAVTLAQEAVEHVPDSGAYWNTLGAAHYRAGNWGPCRAALERSMQARGGGDGFDWFFLAMVYHKLERPADARQWLDRAVGWAEQLPQPAAGDHPLVTQQKDLARREAGLLRREAEELILGRRPDPESK
jgi:tetratricopeptide (TPR) repeat protein